MEIIQKFAPLFFVFIAIELWIAHRRKQQLYRFSDTLADLGTGVIEQVTEFFIRLVFLIPYAWIAKHWGLFRWDLESPLAWICAFVLVDFVYYWFHRLSHSVAMMWAAHSVHHQSEEYNLAVALRQSSVQTVFNSIFFLQLAILGLPFEMLIPCYAINLIYQFFIHTRVIDRLGFFEFFMNTPSHHRVHHGKNPKYCDRNHAGVFIIWDRLFGSFTPEAEEPVYGVVSRFDSWNPLWANIKGFKDLWDLSRQCRSFSDQIKVWFKPPGWRPEYLGGMIPIPEVSVETQIKPPETILERAARVKLGLHFSAALLGSLAFQEISKSQGFSILTTLSGALVISYLYWIGKKLDY